MSTMTAALRIVVEHAEDTGEQPAKTLDTKTIDRNGLVISDYDAVTPGKRILLAVDADDLEVTITSATAVLIVSLDYPFSLRLAAGETLLTNLRAFVVWGNNETDAVATASVLLTGNGTNVARLELWTIDTVS